jgi:hypothetical protein
VTGYEPNGAALRADVEALCEIVRDSAGAGELAAARWAQSRLLAIGAHDVRIEAFRGRRTNSWSFAAHGLAGLLAQRLGGLRGAALALATLVSLERDASGRAPWRRRPAIAGGGGANVVARIPSRSQRRATAILVAHLDAAKTGLVWHPRANALGAGRHLRTRRVDPVMGLQAAGLLASAATAASGSRGRAGRAVAALGAALNGAAVVLNLDIARSPVVPGANDNASGVAASLDIAASLAAQPLEHVEVVIALVGCEETGMGGMHALIAGRRGELPPGSTFVLGVDTLGCGTPILAAGEGAVLTHRYRERDLAIVDEGAALAGEPAPQRWRIGGWTDPLIALGTGIPAVSLLSIGPGYYPHYHHPSDLPEHVDWDSVAACARIAYGTLRALDRRA